MERAERIAPQLVRNHPVARKTVRALLDAETRGYRERVRRLPLTTPASIGCLG